MSTTVATASRPRGRSRVPYLESIRGIAAIQVVLLHLVSAFAPALLVDTLASHSWAGYVRATPLSHLYDGNSAVYFFFVLSGYVLTLAFAADADRPIQLFASRLVRLAIPILAAGLFAAVVYSVFGSFHVAAGHLTGSTWLSDGWTPDAGIVPLLHDSLVNGLLVGYRDAGAAAALNFGFNDLAPATKSYVAPFWTISIELLGSVLIIVLVVLRQRSRNAWLIAAGIGIAALLWTPFLAFLLGHCAAVNGTIMRKGDRPVVTVALIVGGLLMLTQAERADPVMLDAACSVSRNLYLPCVGGHFLEQTIGAVLILLAVARSAPLRQFLSHPAFVLLGGLSFPIYLVHWSFVMGIGSFIVLVASPMMGVAWASVAAAVAVILLVAAGAPLFGLVDHAAIALSRRVRKARRSAAVASAELASNRQATNPAARRA